MKNLLIILFVCICNCVWAAVPDTLHLHFKLDQDELGTTEKALLDGMVYEDAINDRKDILIIGYADYIGSQEYNIELSERRAKAIQKHLINLNIPEANIKMVVGKGEIERGIPQAGGYATDRRVDVIISDKKKVTTPPPTIASNKTPAKEPKTNTPTQLTDLKVGQSIRLNNINFLMGRHVLMETSIPTLVQLYETLAQNPTMKIQIEGHVCCLRYGFDAEDDDTHEPKLSENRAKYIYDYLVSKGIDKSRMQYKGFGRSQPLVSPERTPEDEDQNRRVEIRVLEK